jgi:hypothetical protein
MVTPLQYGYPSTVWIPLYSMDTPLQYGYPSTVWIYPSTVWLPLYSMDTPLMDTPLIQTVISTNLFEHAYLF